MLYFLQSFFIVLLEIFCCKIFFESFGVKREEKNHCKNYGILCALVLSVYALAIFLNRTYFGLKETLIILITSIVMFFYLKIKFWKSVVLALLYQGLLLVIDYFTLLICAPFFQDVSEISFSRGSFIIALGKMVLFLVVLLIRKYMGNDASDMMSETEWLRFIVFPVFTICIIAAMISVPENITSQKQEKIYFVIAFGLAGMNIVVFYLIHDILEREAKIRENKGFRLQAKNQMSMYDSISENYEKQRKQAHEYRNQIECIDALVKREKYEELRKYIYQLRGNLGEEIDFIHTNHAIINAVLNTKYREMISKNIVFVFRINDLSKIQLSDEDIVVILSNLLNNAIEACEICQKKKVIRLKFVLEEEFLVLSVKNTYEHEIIYKGDQIQTSKKEDGEEHGIGIKNVKETVNKYGWRYTVKDNGNEFCFSIIIPHRCNDH